MKQFPYHCRTFGVGIWDCFALALFCFVPNILNLFKSSQDTDFCQVYIGFVDPQLSLYEWNLAEASIKCEILTNSQFVDGNCRVLAEPWAENRTKTWRADEVATSGDLVCEFPIVLMVQKSPTTTTVWMVLKP